MLTLPILILPSYSVASSSRIGDTILHGPHHSAQKSTSTGWPDLVTSVSKFVAVRFKIFATAIILFPENIAAKWIYFKVKRNSRLPTAPRPMTAAAIASPRSKPLMRLTVETVAAGREGAAVAAGAALFGGAEATRAAGGAAEGLG